MSGNATLLPARSLSPASAAKRSLFTVDYFGLRFTLVCAAVWAAGLVIGFVTSLKIMTAIGFLAAIAGIFLPAVGMFGVGILCTLDALTRVYLLTGGLLRWNTFNYWLVIVILLASPFLLRLRDIHTRLLQLFLVLLGIGLLYSPAIMPGIQHMLGAASLFGILVYFARADRDHRSWYWLGAICGTVGALGGLVYYLQQDSLPFINPNAWVYFPLTAIFAIALAAGATSVQGPGQHYLRMLAVINFLWVFLTGSRGGMLIAVVVLVYLVSRVPGLSRRAVYSAASLLVGLGLASLFAEHQTYALGRIDKMFNSEYSMSSRTSGRSDLAIGGWRMFLEAPFGVGTGGFAPSWKELEDTQGLTHAIGKKKQAHSAWIKTLAENGVPGIFLHGAFVLSFAYVGLVKRKQRLLFFGLMISFILAVSFLSSEFQGKGLWLLTAGAMLLLHRGAMQQHLRWRKTAPVGVPKSGQLRGEVKARRAAKLSK